MKVYTRVELDMRTWAVLDEESFDYDGPVALLKGGGGGKGAKSPPPPPPPAPKPATEKEMTAASAGAVDDQQRKARQYAGAAGSINTSPMGAPAPVQQQKTLLGQ